MTSGQRARELSGGFGDFILLSPSSGSHTHTHTHRNCTVPRLGPRRRCAFIWKTGLLELPLLTHTQLSLSLFLNSLSLSVLTLSLSHSVLTLSLSLSLSVSQVSLPPSRYLSFFLCFSLPPGSPPLHPLLSLSHTGDGS